MRQLIAGALGLTRGLEKAPAAADKLKAAGLRPNIVRSNANYVMYIATADLLKTYNGEVCAPPPPRSATRNYLNIE